MQLITHWPESARATDLPIRTARRYLKRGVDISNPEEVAAEARRQELRMLHQQDGLLSGRELARRLGISANIRGLLARAAAVGVLPRHRDDDGHPRFTAADVERFRPFIGRRRRR